MFMHYIGENLINNLVGIYGMHLVKIHIYGNILVYEFSWQAKIILKYEFVN